MSEKEKRKGTPLHTKRFLIIGILIGVVLTSLFIGLGNYLTQNATAIYEIPPITTWLNIPPTDGKPQVQDIAISPDGDSIATLYTVGDSSSVVIHSFDPATGVPSQQVAQLQADGVYHDVEWSSDGIRPRILLASDESDGNGIIHSICLCKSRWTFAGNFMAIASEDGLLAIANGSAITFYDSDTGQLISSMDVEAPVTHLALSPDAQWLTYVVTSSDGEQGDHYVVATTPHSQDQTTSPVQSSYVWNHHYTDVMSVPQGDRVLLLSETEEDRLINHNIELAGATTGRPYKDDHIHAVAVAGYQRAVALNDQIQLHQYQQREGWTTLQWVDDSTINIGNVEHIAFTLDGHYLYAVDADHMMLWDIESRTMIDQWALSGATS